MSDAERERYARWWLEESGLSVDELHRIAVGLTGPSVTTSCA
jgi:hypothetical protein